MLRCMFCFFVCNIGLRVDNLLITYDDDDDDEIEKPTSPTLKTCEWEQYWIRQTSNLVLNVCGRFEIFESARHFRIEFESDEKSNSNRDVLFEFESNIEASQVPSYPVNRHTHIHTGLHAHTWTKTITSLADVILITTRRCVHSLIMQIGADSLTVTVTLNPEP